MNFKNVLFALLAIPIFSINCMLPPADFNEDAAETDLQRHRAIMRKRPESCCSNASDVCKQSH